MVLTGIGTMPDKPGGTCVKCREALGVWTNVEGYPSGDIFCDACFWAVTAPFKVERGTPTYKMSASGKKGAAIDMTEVEWNVIENKDGGKKVGSRKTLTAANNLCAMLNANAGHTVEVEYSDES